MKAALFALWVALGGMVSGMAAEPAFLLGLDQPGLYRPLLQGKRIALVVNQASVSGGVHAIEKLRFEGLKLVKLFALEHGVRGLGGAGEKIGDSVDEKSGLPILSLYGDSRKPKPAMLEGVDAIVYDIQDVGVRFFTYISSLGLILEAAAEQGLPVVVLDRPNPNGDYVEGPVLKPENKSFVGAYPIPLVYGLTAGELAKMIHGESWKHTVGLQLHVIPMQGYNREKIVAPEKNPSPNLRNLKAIRAYPTLALLEPTIVSVGRGTEQPFLQYGLPGENLGGHSFTPHRPEGAKEPPPYDGQLCQGEEFFSRKMEAIPHFTTDLFANVMAKVKRRPFVTDQRFLELLLGDRQVVADLLAGKPYAEIRNGFRGELDEFSKKRKAYLLY